MRRLLFAQLARRRGGEHVQRGAAAGAGARWRACTCRSTGRSCRREDFGGAQRRCPQVARRDCSRRSWRGDELAPQLPAIAERGVQFSRAAASRSSRTDGCRCSSSSTARRRRSRISARAFSPPAFARLRQRAARPLTILVATSGDTGGAVAAAFHGRPGIEVVVLFPKGLVSPTQERQLTCWGGNVHVARGARHVR